MISYAAPITRLRYPATGILVSNSPQPSPDQCPLLLHPLPRLYPAPPRTHLVPSSPPGSAALTQPPRLSRRAHPVPIPPPSRSRQSRIRPAAPRSRRSRWRLGAAAPTGRKLSPKAGGQRLTLLASCRWRRGRYQSQTKPVITKHLRRRSLLTEALQGQHQNQRELRAGPGATPPCRSLSSRRPEARN